MSVNETEKVTPPCWKNGTRLRVVDIGSKENDDLCEEGLIVGDTCTVEDERVFSTHPFVIVRLDRNQKLKHIEKTRFEVIA